MESLKDAISKLRASMDPTSTPGEIDPAALREELRATEEYGCERCRDVGYLARRNADVPVGHPEYLIFRACPDCNKPKVSGVPVSRMTDTFANFDLGLNPKMRPAYERCKAVADGREWCAFLVGSYGNGKTHLAIAAIHERGAGQFWKTPDLLNWLRRSAYDDGMGIDKALDQFRLYRHLLVLDDFGVENRTEWASEQLYLALDARYEERLPTIITTNVERSRIDGRIFSRFREGRVVCEGEDLREVIAQRKEGC